MFVDLTTVCDCVRTVFSRRWRTRKRVVYGLAAIAALGAVYLINAFTRMLDELFFPGYRSVEIRPPVIITANPRSGTTFLHRLLSLDEQRFCSFQLRHTLLSSISMAKLTSLVSRVDRAAGRPLRRLIDRAFEKGFQRWKGIHSLGFSKPEEDEGLVMFTFTSCAVYAIFPFFEEVPVLRFADTLSGWKRRALVRYYRRSVKRFLFTHGRGRTFLLKSVLLAGRLNIMREVFPEARIAYLVRHPYEVLPSFVSMFTAMWKIHSPDIPDNSPHCREWAKLCMDYYNTFHENLDVYAEASILLLRYEDLVADPLTTVRSIYDQFGLPYGEQFDARLRRDVMRHRRYHSNHDYSLERYGIERSWVRRELESIFDLYGLEP